MFIVAQSVLETVYLTNALIVFHAIYQRKTLYEVHPWSFYIKTYSPSGISIQPSHQQTQNKLMRWPQRCGLYQPAFKEIPNAKHR
jgi:hypothetical protein